MCDECLCLLAVSTEFTTNAINGVIWKSRSVLPCGAVVLFHVDVSCVCCCAFLSCRRAVLSLSFCAVVWCGAVVLFRAVVSFCAVVSCCAVLS